MEPVQVQGLQYGVGDQDEVFDRDYPSNQFPIQTEEQEQEQDRVAMEVDFSVSIPIMSLRKSIRRYRGSYKPSQVLYSGIWFAILVWLWGIDDLVLIGPQVKIDFAWQVADQQDSEDQVHVGVGILFFYAGLLGLAVLLWYQIKREIRESFYVAVMCSLAMVVVIVKDPLQFWWMRNFIMIVYAVLMLLVFAYKAFLRNVLPMLHKYDSVITRHRVVFRDEAEVHEDGSTIHPLLEGYRALSQTLHYTTASDWWRSYHCCRRCYQIKYQGMVDERGLPHGFGIWTDNFRFGEHLVGKWHHGRPVGPFKSREWGSGSAFVCRRVAYVQCRGDRLTKFGWYTKLAPLTVGTTAIECSVSGVFYRDYPRISWLYGPVIYDNPATIALHQKNYDLSLGQNGERGQVQGFFENEEDIQRTGSCGEVDMVKFLGLLSRYRRDLSNLQTSISYDEDGCEQPTKCFPIGKAKNTSQKISQNQIQQQQLQIQEQQQQQQQNNQFQLPQVVEQDGSITSQETRGTAPMGVKRGLSAEKGFSGILDLILGKEANNNNRSLTQVSSERKLLQSSSSQQEVQSSGELQPEKGTTRRASVMFNGLQSGLQNIIKDFFKDPERPSSDKITWLIPGERSEFMDIDQFNAYRDGGQSITITADAERGIKISGYVPRQRREFEFLPGSLHPTSLHIRIFEVSEQYQSVAASTPQQNFASSYQFQVFEQPQSPKAHFRTSSYDISSDSKRRTELWGDEEGETTDEGLVSPGAVSNKSDQFWTGNLSLARAHSDISGLQRDKLQTLQTSVQISPSAPIEQHTELAPTSQNIQQLQRQSDQDESKNKTRDKKNKKKYHQSSTSKGEVQIDGWIERTFDVASEALLFIHGYNCSVEHGMKLFAQMIALGNFPAHVRPVVFGWPNSRDWSYYHSQKSCASRHVHLRLLAAIRMLAAEGIQHIHIMSHSMGCRLAMWAVPMLAQALEGDYDDSTQIENPYPGFSLNYFFKYANNSNVSNVQNAIASQPKLKFKKLNVVFETWTLINPEYSLEDFVNYTGPILREKVCPIVTVYGDRMDSALSFSETLNGIRRWWRKEERKPIASPDHLKINPGYRTFEGSSGFARKALDMSLGHHIDYIMDSVSGKYLDVDVISTTYLQGNVHVYRHNYFHLNKEVVEDLRDLILTKRRAYQRASRLEHSHGNVYNFMVAPSHVEAK